MPCKRSLQAVPHDTSLQLGQRDSRIGRMYLEFGCRSDWVSGVLYRNWVATLMQARTVNNLAVLML